MSSFTPSQEQEIADLIRRALDGPSVLIRQLQNAAQARPGQIFITGETETVINTVPGILFCNGAVITSTAYPALYTAIGTAYTYDAQPAGSFRVPDMRQRVPLGSGPAGGFSVRVLGAYGGEERHTLTTSEMPSHTHIQDAHGHGLNAGPSGFGVDAVVPATPVTGSGGGIIPTVATNQNTGGGDPHNNLPPFAVVNWFITT